MKTYFSMLALCAALLAGAAVIDAERYLRSGQAPRPPGLPSIFINPNPDTSNWVLKPHPAVEWVIEPQATKWIVKNRHDRLSEKDLTFYNNTILEGDTSTQWSTAKSHRVFTFLPCDYDAEGKIIENGKCRYVKK